MNMFSPYHYTIRVQGLLDKEWATWLDNMTLAHQYDPQGKPATVLVGVVRDQAALFGLLTKLRDLGLPLISLQSEETPCLHTTVRK